MFCNDTIKINNKINTIMIKININQHCCLSVDQQEI